MEVHVDLLAVTVILWAPEETDRFSVRVVSLFDPLAEAATDRHRLGDVLEATGAGRLADDGEAFIRPDALRFYAEGQVAEDWPERFAAMCEFASTKGWTDASGWIQGHVEWPPGWAGTPSSPSS